MKLTFVETLKALPAERWRGEGVSIQPIANEDDLWFATAECRLLPGQEDYVNPAGFSIGRAWMNPEDNLPCVICGENNRRIGFIIFRKWIGPGEEAYNWSYYLDKAFQGQGYGRTAAELAVKILKAANPDASIKLSTEADNKKAQRLYEALGFMKAEELDGDDLVFIL